MKLAIGKTVPRGGYWLILKKNALTGSWACTHTVTEFPTNAYTLEDMEVIARAILTSGNIEDPFIIVKEIN